ncbi:MULTISPECIES: hypothetical protein [unclassified Corynebacterium]|uniref:hypothetical protein n=1 Tax=unclassified Corynebacterium TaxID=2624378 RepID=UPI0021682EE3|nr:MULTISPECIES: hypothetical protein [unclassified Corynebacterium]MCS4532150.1 hypothetical protein [Corynebacterium sp. ES2730-CONJ]
MTFAFEWSVDSSSGHTTPPAEPEPAFEQVNSVVRIVDYSSMSLVRSGVSISIPPLSLIMIKI